MPIAAGLACTFFCCSLINSPLKFNIWLAKKPMALSLQQLHFLLFLLLLHFILLLSNAHGEVWEKSLLEGINFYRQSLNLTNLTAHDKASCLAGVIAKQLQNQLCTTTAAPIAATAGASQQYPELLAQYPKLLKSCCIGINTTRDGVILPICTPKLLANDLICTNCTQPQYSKYLHSSDYHGAGIRVVHRWTVIVLSTNTTAGNFTSASHSISNVRLNHCLFLLLFLIFKS